MADGQNNLNVPGVNPLGGQHQPGIIPPGGQQQPGSHAHPQFQQQPQPMPAEAVIMQLIEQLRQQQIITNQLLQHQHEAAQHHQGFLQQQQQLFREAVTSIQVNVPPNPEAILDSLAGNIREFQYDLDSNVTFSTWYARYEDLFSSDAERLDDAAKVRLLLRRLGTSEHARYVSFILPEGPKAFSFAETVEKLTSLFSTKDSTVKKRFSTLTITKVPLEDYVSYGCRLNKMCVEFELSKMSEEQFKCLMFVCGLKSEVDTDVRTRLLSKIEDSEDVTLQSLMDECQRMINLKSDAAMIENPVQHQVQSIKGRRLQYKQSPEEPRSDSSPGEEHHNKQKPRKERSKVPPSPCWFCGAMHFVKFCTYRDHQCEDCDEYGHKEGYCCSARNARKSSNSPDLNSNSIKLASHEVRHTRRYVTMMLNGVPVRMQLDTASDVTMVSEAVWDRIGRPATHPSTHRVSCASGRNLVLREFDCSVTIDEIVAIARIFVTTSQLNLLGIDLINQFNLWSLPMNKFCDQMDRGSEDSQTKSPTVSTIRTA